MKSSLSLVASALTLFAAAHLRAAAPAGPAAPALPVISVQAVETEDSSGYMMWVAKANELAKAKLGEAAMIHSYIGVAAGADTGVVFNVSSAENFATLLTRATPLEKDADILANSQHYRGLRKLGPRVLAKATRFEGAHKGGALYNTYANITDEAGYSKALDQLHGLLQSHGINDIFISVYRIVAGRTDYTHIVVLSGPSMEQIGAVLDSTSEPWMTEWFAGAAKLRTVVRNATYREITQQ